MISNKRAALASLVIALLAERWPLAFHVYGPRRRPLKVGVHGEIAAAMDGAMTPREIAIGLRFYTMSQHYQRSLTRAGAVRIGLDGEAAGVVTADEAKQAAEELAQRSARRKATPVVTAKPSHRFPSKLTLRVVA